MTEPKNQQVLHDINGKIEREKKLIQGFQALKRNTDNGEVIQRCNNQIRETQSNIDYLQKTLSKLSLQKSEAELRTKEESNESGKKPVYSRFDLIKYDCPSLGHRILYMLQQLQFKLQVENQYREANEKISHLYRLDGDKSSSIVADTGRLESDQRIQLLNKSLKRYQDMHIDVEDVTRDMEIMNTPKYASKAFSGKLNISVTCIRDIDHIASPTFSKRPESVVSIKIDDVERAKTRGTRSGKWNEEFHIDIDKGNEIEFSVYDKSGSVLVAVAVTWALLSDISEEIRKKKVAQEVGSEGWVLASNLPNNNSKQHNDNYPSGSEFGATSNTTSTFNGSPKNYNSNIPSNMDSPVSGETKQVQINTWLSLEPVGQVLVSVSLDKSNQAGNRQFMGALGRHGAIREKKEEVFKQHGHQFVQKQFYNIMCCAFCGEFLRYTGFQCQDCKFLCHKKCFQKVVTKCISKSSNDLDPDEAKLNHRIPHRFDPVTNHGTKWCCHCGYILPWGRKNVRKCSECGVMCHAHCTHLVPDFCGMSMEMANKILTTIKSTRTPGKPLPPPPAAPLADQPNASSDASKFSSSTSDSKSDTLQNISDDEQEKYYASRLPTETKNQFQKPIESQYKPTGRRPPPNDLSKESTNDLDQEKSESYDHDYTFMSSKSEEMKHGDLDIPESRGTKESNEPNEPTDMQIDNPFANPIENDKSHFDNFDYNNNNKIMVPEIPQKPEHKEPQADYQTQQKSEVPQSKGAVPHKPKRRRRKIGLDDFQFLAVLGKGNFGKVMLAESRHTQNLCAIKVLKKDFIVENDEADSVTSEKRVFLTANKEMHPFLLNLHCCFQTENRIYFVMEYISGGDLMWHIQKSRFSAKRAKFYACEVLLALKYFHDNGIVYRDLKLDNILLTTKGHIKIADYGLCKENMWHKSTTGTFCGTPVFMAPEIIAGKQYERSVDWWAFGVLLFQMLLCQSPFKGDDDDEVFNAIEHDDVKYPISMPRQTVLVLQALLTKDPANRLGSGERDAEEIMEHPYFQDVNFDDILNCRIQAPYLPEVSSEHDYSNFDQEFTSETPRLTPVETVLTSEMQEQFRGFSHISDDAAI